MWTEFLYVKYFVIRAIFSNFVINTYSLNSLGSKENGIENITVEKSVCICAC